METALRSAGWFLVGLNAFFAVLLMSQGEPTGLFNVLSGAFLLGVLLTTRD